jgi:hypothetical protein
MLLLNKLPTDSNAYEHKPRNKPAFGQLASVKVLIFSEGDIALSIESMKKLIALIYYFDGH